MRLFSLEFWMLLIIIAELAFLIGLTIGKK